VLAKAVSMLMFVHHYGRVSPGGVYTGAKEKVER
jgi:hypothetical protein